MSDVGRHIEANYDRAIDFASKIIFARKGNLRFLLALLDGEKTTTQLKEQKIMMAGKIFSYMALVEKTKLGNVSSYKLTHKGRNIAEALSYLIDIIDDNIPQ